MILCGDIKSKSPKKHNKIKPKEQDTRVKMLRHGLDGETATTSMFCALVLSTLYWWIIIRKQIGFQPHFRMIYLHLIKGRGNKSETKQKQLVVVFCIDFYPARCVLFAVAFTARSLSAEWRRKLINFLITYFMLGQLSKSRRILLPSGGHGKKKKQRNWSLWLAYEKQTIHNLTIGARESNSLGAAINHARSEQWC